MENFIVDVEKFIVAIYRLVFGRRVFLRLNHIVYQCGLRGLGVLNYESSERSGERRFLSRYLNGMKDCVVFDVGANVGKYSAEIFRINPTAVVYAFEPHPKTFETLRSSLQHSHFFPNNLALGDEEGTLTLYDYADRDGSSHASLYKDVIEKIHKAKSVQHVVGVTTLHSFLKRAGIDAIDLLSQRFFIFTNIPRLSARRRAFSTSWNLPCLRPLCAHTIRNTIGQTPIKKG